MARQNAENAGVDHLIHFQERPVSALSHPKKYGFIITNPPYGERLEEKKRHFLVYIVNLARALGNLTAGLHT